MILVYQKIFKFKNGSGSRENSLYFTIPLRQRRQRVAGLFRSENFDVKDDLRSGRPITKKSDEILEKLKQDIKKHVILRKLANLIDFRFQHVCVQSL